MPKLYSYRKTNYTYIHRVVRSTPKGNITICARCLRRAYSIAWHCFACGAVLHKNCQFDGTCKECSNETGEL